MVIKDLAGKPISEGSDIQKAVNNARKIPERLWCVKSLLRVEDFRVNLQAADFRGQYLKGVVFSDAQMRGCCLASANLSGAKLKKADLRKSDLTGADLSGADLTDADLREADLSGADLRGAVLNGVRWHKANVEGVKVD